MQGHPHTPPPEEDNFFDDDLARLNAEANDDEDFLTYDEFPRVPLELKRLDQWVNWKQDEGRKIPLNPRTLRNAGVAYENTWSTFGFAAAVAAREELGIGFVLTKHDSYTRIDLDKVLHGKQLEPYAREILDAMTGYVELSPSGTGLHVWVKSREAINRRTQGIEIYSDHRWMTVTGRANPKAPTEIPDRTGEVKALVEARFPKLESTAFTRPREVEPDDAALWQRLFSTKNGNFMQALYDGDLSVVKDDHSRGVIMLANMLALYTHSDAKRVESLLAQTNLVNDKWYEKRGRLTWIEFQVRDAIDSVHRRELARQTKEEQAADPQDERRKSTSPKKTTRSDAGPAATRGGPLAANKHTSTKGALRNPDADTLNKSPRSPKRRNSKS